MSNDKLIEKIAASKKYKGVYLKTITRIVKNCSEKYEMLRHSEATEKQVEKKAKNLLHQAWGAYFDNRPDFKKILDSFNGKTKQAILHLLSIQSSTKERIPVLDDFYKEIFRLVSP